MAKQLTLFECLSASDTESRAKRRTDTSPDEDNGRNDIQPTLQENTVFVDSPTGPTTIIFNDSCNPVVSLGSSGDSRHDLMRHTEHEQDEDAGNTQPEPTTSTSHTTTSDILTDIAAGPDQPLVQPKIKFPTTLKGNRYRSFNSEWYKQYCWLKYSRAGDAAYCYPCCLFTTESGRYWETFTKNGFCDWKHAMGKDGIIFYHDRCKTHMQAMVAWQEYMKNKASGTSNRRHTRCSQIQVDYSKSSLFENNTSDPSSL